MTFCYIKFMIFSTTINYICRWNFLRHEYRFRYYLLFAPSICRLGQHNLLEGDRRLWTRNLAYLRLTRDCDISISCTRVDHHVTPTLSWPWWIDRPPSMALLSGNYEFCLLIIFGRWSCCRVCTFFFLGQALIWFSDYYNMEWHDFSWYHTNHDIQKLKQCTAGCWE